MTGRLLRMGLALAISASLLAAPGFAAAQSQSQPPPPQQNQNQNQNQEPNPPGAAPGQPGQYQPAVAPGVAPAKLPQDLPPAASSAETEAARNLKATFGHDFSVPPRPFPDISAPYRQIKIDPLVLTNSPRIQQLVKDGKLLLSLEDAITLAVENNLGINIARYTPWEAEADLLRAKSGQTFFGVPQLNSGPDFANIPTITFDPIFTANVNVADATIPV